MLNDSSEPVPTKAVKKTWPSPWAAFFITVTLFVAAQIVGVISILMLQLWFGDTSVEDANLFGSTVLLQFAYALVVYGGLLAVLWRFLRWRGVGRRELGLSRPRWADAGLAALAFVIYAASFAVLQQLLPYILPGLDLEQRQDTGFGDAANAGVLPLILTFVALVVVAPVAEETLMRGFLFGALRRRMPFIVATLFTSLLFAFLHLAGGEAGAGPLWVAAIDTFLLSVILCYLREKTGRLWASIGLHMLKNGIAFVLLFIIGIEA